MSNTISIQTGLTKLHNEFTNFEKSEGLFSTQIQDTPYWEWARFEVFEYLMVERQLHQEWRSSTKISVKKRLFLTIKTLFHFSRNPFTAPASDLLFIGHPRRKLRDDGLWWDLYCDPIFEEFEGSWVYSEFLFGGKHDSPAKTEERYFMEIIPVLAGIAGTIKPLKLSTKETELLAMWEKTASDTFNCPIPLIQITKKALTTRRYALPLWKRLLRRIKPKAVFMVVNNGREYLLEGCRHLNIPVIELQHGTISKFHMAYSYPEGTRINFPDYLFTHGPHWKTAAQFPIAQDHIIDIGFPLLEESILKYQGTQKKYQIVFVSQGSVGRELSKFATEYKAIQTDPIEVIYKLHPSELYDWKVKYPWLVNSGITVIDDNILDLNQILAESLAQVGVFSTALYEGLALGCMTFCVKLPGVEFMENVIVRGDAQLVEMPDEIHLDRELTSFDKEHYFCSNWQERFTAALATLNLDKSIYPRS